MNPLAWFSAGSKAAEKVLDGAIAGVDKVFYTDEEKADASRQLWSAWVDLQKNLGEETTVRSVTRRVLALLIVVPYVALVLVAVVAKLRGAEESATFLFQVAEGNFGTLTLMVGGFYFGPPMIQRAIESWKGKK